MPVKLAILMAALCAAGAAALVESAGQPQLEQARKATAAYHYRQSSERLRAAPNRHNLPPFYSLPVWISKNNSDGLFATWNPDVSCANA